MAGFSACIKAHCSPAAAFRIHFPRWHKRSQRQFVTAEAERAEREELTLGVARPNALHARRPFYL